MMYKTLLVGLGNIGMVYDLGKSTKKNSIFSYAKALCYHKKFILSGAVDINSKKCKIFTDLYNVWSTTSLKNALNKIKPDVIILSTPTDQHYFNILDIIKYSQPKLILCEKPITFNYSEAKKIYNDILKTSIKFFVNYPRRLEKGVCEVKNRINNNIIKSPINGVTWYSRGMFTNASHFLNLCEFWLGKVNNFRKLTDHKVNDIDPNINFSITFNKGEILFLATKLKTYSHHEMKLICSNGCLAYDYAGEIIKWNSIINSKKFNNYKVLSKDVELIETDNDNLLLKVLDSILEELNGNRTNLCDLNEAIMTIKPLTKIIEQSYVR